MEEVYCDYTDYDEITHEYYFCYLPEHDSDTPHEGYWEMDEEWSEAALEGPPDEAEERFWTYTGEL